MNSPIDPAIVMPDVQSATDTRHIPIQRVGIRGVRHPMLVQSGDGSAQGTVANWTLTVALPPEEKGTHMSRFIEILNSQDREITVESFESMLRQMVERLEARSGYIEMSFPYFVNKRAPVSGVKSLLDYEVTFIGEIRDGAYHQTVRILVPCTSLCPCSKGISKYGAHNQRSHITITVKTNDFIWIEDLIHIAEANASSQLYGLLKRPDEKFVTEKAYENPKFVEDLVRDVATALNEDARIESYVVESENFESIHNHSAYALIERTAPLSA